MLCSSSWERENITERIPQTPSSVKKEGKRWFRCWGWSPQWRISQPTEKSPQGAASGWSGSPWRGTYSGEGGLRELPLMGAHAGTVHSQRVSPWYGPVLEQCLKSHSLSVQFSSGTSSHRRDFTCGREQELPWRNGREKVLWTDHSPYSLFPWIAQGQKVEEGKQGEGRCL